jgi:sensor histidine kinase YesM
MVSVIYILDFIKLTVLDYSVIFSVIILSDIYDSYWLGNTFFISIIFLSIIYIYKTRLSSLKGNIFNMWLTFFLTIMDGDIFDFVFNRVVGKIGYSFDSALAKVFVWGIAAVIVVDVNLAAIYFLRKIFDKYLYEINEMGKKYPTIEKYYIYISMGILLIIMLVHCVYTALYGLNAQISQLLKIFCRFALVLQVLYLTLLFRVTYFKDTLYNKELENQSLALYSSKLEKNIEDIRNIKHDIKNIFFTMGQYVEQSDNEEMKLFYQTKIYPFAAGEIIKNDLYQKLMVITNEQLKVFLFYKISQALERNIPTEFEIELKRNSFDIAIECIDLVRILGILMDNAIEECMGIADSKVKIKISQNNELACYSIKNTVEFSKKEKGIKVGVSTKGENRGRGLAIVQNTIEKYDCVMLNSYFKEEMFVQNLNIYLEN